MDILWTVPPIGSSLQQTHVSGEEFGVWLVPLALESPMAVRRVSCPLAVSASTARGFAAALYRLEATGFIASKADPATTLKKQTARRLAILSAVSSNATLASPTVKHFDAVGKDEDLDPTRGAYYLGYQSAHAECRWAAPSLTTIEKTSVSVGTVLTTYLGVAATDRALLTFQCPYAGTPAAIRYYIGSHSGSHTATLTIRKRGTNTELVTYAVVGRPAWTSDTSGAVTFEATHYELLLKCSSDNGQSLFAGLIIEWSAQPSTTETMLRALKTKPYGTKLGDFPTALQFTGSVAPPIVASLRSALGVKQFAVLGTD